MSSISSIESNVNVTGATFFNNISVCESYFASAVPVGVETTIFTKVIPSTGRYGILKANYSGRGPALFRLKIDGTTIDYGQIVWTERTDENLFPNGNLVSPSSTITITVFSYDLVPADFFGSISGRQE